MSQPYPLVEVAVVVITDAQGRFLADYNEAWGGFTLPMSSLHDVPARVPVDKPTPESPQNAAIRAAAEVLGRPVSPGALVPLNIEVAPWNQSGRDGQWKRYQYRLFQLKIDFAPQPLPGHAAVWLTRAELGTLEPISLTVRVILRALPA